MCVLPNVLLNIVTMYAWHRSVHNTIDELNFLCEVRKKIPAAFLCPVTVEFRTLLHVASPWYPGSPYVPMCTVRLLYTRATAHAPNHKANKTRSQRLS